MVLNHIGRFKGEDPKWGQTRAGISEHLDIPYPTLCKALDRLLEVGFIKMKPGKIIGKMSRGNDSRRHHHSTAYEITDLGRERLQNILSNHQSTTLGGKK